MRLQIVDQGLAVGLPRGGITDTVQFQAQCIRHTQLAPQAPTEQNQFGVDIRSRHAKGFDTDLVELTQTPFLRTLVPEHRALIPKPLLLATPEKAILICRAHAAGGALRAQAQAVSIAIVEGIHFLFDDIGHLTDGALEQFSLLQKTGKRISW